MGLIALDEREGWSLKKMWFGQMGGWWCWSQSQYRVEKVGF